MKKTFRIRITLADGAVHVRSVSASSTVQLFDRLKALTSQFPTYVKSESCHEGERRIPYFYAPYPFAPGVIERQPHRHWSRTTRISVVRAALVLLVLGSMAAMVSLLTGGL